MAIRINWNREYLRSSQRVCVCPCACACACACASARGKEATSAEAGEKKKERKKKNNDQIRNADPSRLDLAFRWIAGVCAMQAARQWEERVGWPRGETQGENEWMDGSGMDVERAEEMARSLWLRPERFADPTSRPRQTRFQSGTQQQRGLEETGSRTTTRLSRWRWSAAEEASAAAMRDALSQGLFGRWTVAGRQRGQWSAASGQRDGQNGMESSCWKFSGLKGLRRRQGAWLEVGSLAWFAERLPSNQFSELEATLLRGSPRLGAAARDVRPLGWRRETGAQPGCAQVGAIPQTISTAAKPRMQGPIVCLCTKYCTYSVLSCFLFFCFSASSVSSKPTNMAADALGSVVAVAANSEGFGHQRDPNHSHN